MADEAPEIERRRLVYVTQQQLHTELSRHRDEMLLEIRELARKMEKNRQPLTAYAGLLAFVLSMGVLALRPLYETDKRIYDMMDALMHQQLQAAQDRGEFLEFRNQVRRQFVPP